MADECRVVKFDLDGTQTLGITTIEPKSEDSTIYRIMPFDVIYEKPEFPDHTKAVEKDQSELTEASADDVKSYLTAKNVDLNLEIGDYVVFPLPSMHFERCLGKIVSETNYCYSVNLLLPRLDSKTNIVRLPFQFEKISGDEATLMFLSF